MVRFSAELCDTIVYALTTIALNLLSYQVLKEADCDRFVGLVLPITMNARLSKSVVMVRVNM